MAAAGPRGRDGPSPREFTAVRHFMMADLGLSGLPLLVYARIFGFCDAGCGYFESKGGLARFLNVQERSVHRAIRDLLVARGFDASRVDAVGRGEREPIVVTPDNTPEPRNRRAEITIR